MLALAQGKNVIHQVARDWGSYGQKVPKPVSELGTIAANAGSASFSIHSPMPVGCFLSKYRAETL